MTKKSKKDISYDLLFKACLNEDLREVIFQLKHGAKLDQENFYIWNFNTKISKFFIKNVDKHIKLYYNDRMEIKSYLKDISYRCIEICAIEKNIELLEELYYKKFTRISWILPHAIRIDSLEIVKFALSKCRNVDDNLYLCAIYGRIQIFKYLYKFGRSLVTISSLANLAYFHKQFEFLDHLQPYLQCHPFDNYASGKYSYHKEYFEYLSKKIIKRSQQLRKIKMLTTF